MTTVRGRQVERQGNVYCCAFGAARPVARAASSRSSSAAIRGEVAEINVLIREVAATHAGVAEQAAVNSQLLLDAIAKLDSVAFQATLLAHGLAQGPAGEDAACVAADVQGYVGEGAGVVRRLRALVDEHRVRILNLTRALGEIGAQVDALEAVTSARVGPAGGNAPFAD